MKPKLTRQTISYHNLEKRNFDQFEVGDTVIVAQKIKEAGDEGKERIQNFQGTVIAITKRGISSMFTVRKIGAHGVAVERIFPLYAPFISNVKVVSKGAVRRAKLYYVRRKVGKQALIEKQQISAAQEIRAQEEAQPEQSTQAA